MDMIHLTQEGYEKLVEELEHLKSKKRKKISKAIAHARSLGDLRENAEYQAAKEAMANNEKRIRELEDKLGRVEIIDESKMSTDKAYIGAKLKLIDLDTNEELEYILVSQDEANPLNNSISITSPVGKALLGHQVNDVVERDVPAGALKDRIVSISR